MFRVLIVVGIFYFVIDPQEENIIWFVIAIPILYIFKLASKAVSNFFGVN